MAKIGTSELHMNTDTLRTCNQHLSAVLEAMEQAIAKLKGVELHSTWACAERNGMYERVQVELDVLCQLESDCKNLKTATTYLIEKFEETEYEVMWKLNASKSFIPTQLNTLAEMAGELQGNSTSQIRMGKF